MESKTNAADFTGCRCETGHDFKFRKTSLVEQSRSIVTYLMNSCIRTEKMVTLPRVNHPRRGMRLPIDVAVKASGAASYIDTSCSCAVLSASATLSNGRLL